MIWPFKRRLPAPPAPEDRPVRVTVMLKDGRCIVHLAAYRRIDQTGGLHLCNKRSGGGTVADYAAGTWVSVTTGKRCVTQVT